MIGRLSGRVVDEEAIGTMLLDVRGVGYELHCPVGTVGRAKSGAPERAGEIVVYVHTNLRQDSLELFGFCSLEERATFRQLTSVPGVGPRLAIAVLNVLPAEELRLVVEAEDKVRLVRVPGVGKKTAERLVLELRGKLSPTSPQTNSTAVGNSISSTQLSERLIAALTGLGYRPGEAEKAARSLETSGAQGDLSGLLRQALDYLAP